MAWPSQLGVYNVQGGREPVQVWLVVGYYRVPARGSGLVHLIRRGYPAVHGDDEGASQLLEGVDG